MSGKWDDPDVPHDGWECIHVEDLGEPSAICQMCEVQPIRYVHSMEHADYDDVLRCGCICAGHMEQDEQGARDREDQLKSVAVRRLHWPARQWRTSQNGNVFVNVRGFNLVVFGTRKGYGVKIEQRYGERCQWGKQRFRTRTEAQAAAFEALLWAERKWGGNGRYELNTGERA